jgi:prolyl-tRNA synthetase
MKKNNKITARDNDFAQWYTDIVKEAGLATYSPIKGSLIIEEYGYAIWESMQKVLDDMFKKTGHKNVYMPLFISESLLNKEKDHIDGFAPEVAWVTHGGSDQLEERLCVRPTSETLFSDYYSKKIKSYRDLPKLYNQWCNVVRWEKETRPFLRSREFLWQEGHTVHETEKEAREETLQMLDVYETFFKEYLAIPVIKGRKTEKEKFAGAVETYTIEAMMHNGIILQSGTTHYFGTNFSKPFEITFLDRNNELQYAHQSSWGVSTRMIGALVMAHGDDNGLIMPPKIAPNQVVIIPIGLDEKVISKAEEIKKELEENYNLRVIIDNSDKTPGFKFAQNEMLGIPLRIEFGLRDLEKNQIILARRDNYSKEEIIADSDLGKKISKVLKLIQDSMYDKALKRREERTYICTERSELEDIVTNKPGFIKAMWCGDESCETSLKQIGGLKSRCIPFEEEQLSDKCINCGKKAKKMLYWGIQY